MPRFENFMALFKTRYSLAELLLLTAAVAVFCVVLMNDNKWLRATYVTASLGVLLNAFIAAIFARGQRQAFALGFVVGALSVAQNSTLRPFRCRIC